jgi:glycosyltransferase involved in cell wall biosynthesis
MKIGIDVHSIGSGKGGNETYYRQLVHALFRADLENKYVLYGTRTGASELGSLQSPQFRICQLAHSSPYTRIPFGMPAQAGRDSLDIFHSQYIVPPFLRARTVNTIFDIAYEHLPELFPAYQRAWSKRLIRWSATRADHILTISEFSKRSIANTYRIPEDRITVTYPAAGDEFRPMDKAAAKEDIARKYGIRDDFILYLGRLQGRKNLPALIRAYAQVRKSGVEHKLVLAGKPDSLFAPTVECIRKLGLQTEVLLPGYVAGEDVPKFYNAADVFVYPSVYEGFGLPVLEAMACGVPVITSRGSALEEIAGDAALLVEPPDDVAIANAIQLVLQNSELRTQLTNAGIKRSSQFSFANTARQTIDVYTRVAGMESSSRMRGVIGRRSA